MIITTIEELRLYIPNHAIDDIKVMSGYFDASEHDTLVDKVGRDLYDKVLDYYSMENTEDYIDSVANNQLTSYYGRLLMMCQRIVAFDSMRSAVGTMTLSVNGAGINTPVADDYGKTDKDALSEFKASCNTNLHKSINVLLQTLEEWVARSASLSADDDDYDVDLEEIATLWKKSRYYYLSANLVIPCATVLQDYLNFYENREKFIQMLPDLRYIQEDILADRIGEELIDWFVGEVNNGTEDHTVLRCVDKLRKTMAMFLESRTNVLSTTKERMMKAHDEALALLERTAEFIEVRQTSLPASCTASLKLSPLYHQPETQEAQSHYEPRFRNNRKGNAIFVMPGMN